MNEFEYSTASNVKENNVDGSVKNKPSFALKIFTIIVIAFTAGVAGFFFTKVITDSRTRNVIFTGDINGNAAKDAKIVDFNKYWQLIQKLEATYPGKIDTEKLFEGSLKGLVSGLDDPATEYFTAEEYAKYKEVTSGEKFSGIGIEFNTDNSLVKIINVFDGSPAMKAGVQINDYIDRVDGESISGKTNDQVALKIKGEKGTKVKLNLIRSGKPVELEIIRDDIKVPAMTYKSLDGNIAYVDLNRFTAGTLQEWTGQWDSVVTKINEQNPKAIILDLRSNGGGFVAASTYAASDFVDAGKLIVSEKGKIANSNEDVKSQNNLQRLKKYRLYILVNNYSASASEIFSGALQHYGVAKVIGINTYGKGTVQQIFDKEFKDGSAVKITIANWILPSGRIISKDTPINPDIKIEQDTDALRQGKDNVLDKAIEEINK